MAADSKWTWETSVALVLAYGIMGSLVLWGFGWPALRGFATATAQGLGIGAVALVATWVLLAVVAVLVVLFARMMTARRAKRLP